MTYPFAADYPGLHPLTLISTGLLGLLLTGCASKLPAPDYSFETVDRLADQQWAEYKDDDRHSAFNTDWLLFNNANGIDQKNGCYVLGSDVEDLILIQNSEGVIQHVVLKRSTPKSECFKEVFLGVRYPAPPVAPYYHFMRMQN